MDIYLIAGQSNALGISPIKDLKGEHFYPNAMLYQASNVHIPCENTVVPIRPGLGADVHKFGLELGAALAFDGRKVGFIKYTSDGTSLYDRWSENGEDFVGLKETYFAGMEAFCKLDSSLRVCGFLWMQGENDAGDRIQAEAYREKLFDFIGKVRQFAGQVPFVLGETNPFNAVLPFSAAVNEAKKIVAQELPAVIYVPTGDLVQLIDNYHYSADNMLRLGERMAKALW